MNLIRAPQKKIKSEKEKQKLEKTRNYFVENIIFVHNCMETEM